MAPVDPMPSSLASALPKAGDIVSGKYRIEKMLAEGGMGVVFEATHLQLDEKVAIKFLRTEFTGPEAGELAGRFLREARTSAKIKSEHVVRVHDVGALDHGAPYIVMEFLTGKDLDQVVSQYGVLGVQQAIDYVLQACEALAEAHNIGIVHRDLKPANLFLIHRADGSACVKVLDFGISKFKDATSNTPDMGMTKTHAVMGSPRYMSPEQMRSSKDVDARADIWAIGIILYELLAGTVPFNGDSMPQICAAILEETPKNLRMLRPEITVELDAIVAKCLAKKADDRFANIAHLAHALSAFGTAEARASASRIGRVLRVSGTDVNADTAPRDFTVPFSAPPSMPSPAQSYPSSPGRTAGDAGSVSGASATAVAWTGIDPGGPETKRRRRTIAVAFAVAAIAGFGAIVLVTRHHAAPANAPVSSIDTSQSAAPTQPPPPLVADTTSMPAAGASAAAAATTTASAAPSTPAAPAIVASAKPAGTTRHATTPSHATAAPPQHASSPATQSQSGDMWGERK